MNIKTETREELERQRDEINAKLAELDKAGGAGREHCET